MLVIGEDTASIGVVHEPIAFTSLSEVFLQTFSESEVDLDSTLCTSVYGLSHDDYLC